MAENVPAPMNAAAPRLEVQSEDDWRDDPSADERWQAGCDFAMVQLCHCLAVDPKSVRWDAATETLDGDVSAVLWNILIAKMGEDWDPHAPAQAPIDPINKEYYEGVIAEMQAGIDDLRRAFWDGIDVTTEKLAPAALALITAFPKASSIPSAPAQAVPDRDRIARIVQEAIEETYRDGTPDTIIQANNAADAILALPIAQAQIDPFMEDYKRDTIAGLIEHCASVAETYSDQGRDGHQIAKAIRALATPSADCGGGK